MPGLSDYLENSVCSWLKGTQMPTPPTTLYVGLFNGDPTDTGTGGTEVTTSIRLVGRPTCTFGTVSDGTMSNSAVVDFSLAEGNCTVTHFGIFSANTGGNMLFSGQITGNTTSITSGTAVTFPVGSLVFNIT